MSNAHTIILDSSQSKFGCILVHRIVGIASLWSVDSIDLWIMHVYSGKVGKQLVRL